MKIVGSIIDFVFPRICHVCGENLPHDARFVCPACLSRLPRTLYHRTPDNAMERRFMGQFPFRAATGHFFYTRESAIATLIHDMKYRKFRSLASFLGEEVAAELLPTGFLSDIDMIVPVPMHFMKKARRGYNQTEEISKGISKIVGIPVADNLRAVRGHRTQTSLSLESRIRNVEGVFRVKNPEELTAKSILIVDDVCTTGATLSAAAIALHKAADIRELSLLTLAVTF